MNVQVDKPILTLQLTVITLYRYSYVCCKRLEEPFTRNYYFKSIRHIYDNFHYKSSDYNNITMYTGISSSQTLTAIPK